MARISAVTVGRTVGALVDAVAAGNWVNGNPSLSLSVDDLSAVTALTSNSTKSKAVFTPQLWDQNGTGTGTQPGARVHTRSTASSRFGTSRPHCDTIAVERFRSGSGWLCDVTAKPDAFRSRLASPCVIMKNMQHFFPKKVCPS